MNKLIEKILENRGITLPEFYALNNPEYPLLRDIDKLVVNLKEVSDRKEAITVLPDFDMDGICSGVLGYVGLAELGFKVNLYIPDPNDGYGFDPSIAEDLLQMYPETKAVITCDTGITCLEGISYLKSKGIKVFVTDHHIEGERSEADVIVDPMRTDETYPHPAICGAFVFYQVLQRYADVFHNGYVQSQISRLRAFAGMGTVSDVMPMLYENRKIVRDAVDIARVFYNNGDRTMVDNLDGCSVYKAAFRGIHLLYNLYASKGNIKSEEDINEIFFGYYIAPLFNSVKRMSGNMDIAFMAFLGEEDEQKRCIEELYNVNTKRKTFVAKEFDKMMTSQQPFAPYIYLTDSSAGILGLMAMKVTAITGHPVLVLNDNGVDGDADHPRYAGSGRSPEWYVCMDRFHGMARVAGHVGAFGCSVSTFEDLAKLFAFMKADVPAVEDTVETVEVKPDFVIATDASGDVMVDIVLFEEFLDELDEFRPFGRDWPEPWGLFKFADKDVVTWKVFGKASNHLKIILQSGFELILWNQADKVNNRKPGAVYGVTGMLEHNTYDEGWPVHFKGDLVV